MHYTHIFTDGVGDSCFENIELSLTEQQPMLRFTERFGVGSVFFAIADAGRRRPRAPEPRRNWVLLLTGSLEITASSETRTSSPGDLLLFENVDGDGHSSFTPNGFTAALVVL